MTAREEIQELNDERCLVEKHFGCPVILYDYPAKIKAFYMSAPARCLARPLAGPE